MVTNLLTNLAVKGSDSRISKSVSAICINSICVMMYSPTVALLIFNDLWSAAMQLTFAKI